MHGTINVERQPRIRWVQN